METTNGSSKLEELSQVEKLFKEFIREKRYIANLSQEIPLTRDNTGSIHSPAQMLRAVKAKAGRAAYFR